MDEAQMHQDNSFITLTYADEYMPENKSLKLRDFQLFMKRLRRDAEKPIRFYHCGEYGEKYKRPHYHACLFGYDFKDKTVFKSNVQGDVLYTSKKLQELWPKGHSMVGDVTFESAAYVARYIMKKITGDIADENYVNKETGELRKPEYTTMSRRPGIGRPWYDLYKTDVYPFGKKVLRGIEVSPPRFYDNIYEKQNPEQYKIMKQKRQNNIDIEENSSYRLLAKEEVTQQRIKNLSRLLESEI